LTALRDLLKRRGETAAVALLVLAALAVRLGYLVAVTRRPGFRWIDPDRYSTLGSLLANGEGGWRWTLDAVLYLKHVKAPLYPVILSLFALLPAPYPFSAAVGQAVASAACVGFLFVIGRGLHSGRAGFIAAFLYAIYLPSIFDVAVIQQESFHIPFLLGGFALMVDAVAREASPWRFALAGAVLGLAALVRSMPVYYVGPAALLFAILGGRVAADWRRAGALLAGFVAVTAPYILYISAAMGHLVLIDNMGSIHFGTAYPHSRAVVHNAPPPTLPEIALMFVRTFASAPLKFIGDRIEDLRGLFMLRGGRWLQLHAHAATAAGAAGLKLLAHVCQDAPFGISAVLAPLGWAFARQRRAAALVGLWVVMYVGLLAALTWSGASYRAPYEPHLMALAAVVLAGGWRRPPAWALAAAAGASLFSVWAVAASLSTTARGRAEYGIAEWWVGEGGRKAKVAGGSGFTVVPVDDQIQLTVVPWEQPAADDPVRVRMRVEGRPAGEVVMDSTEQRWLIFPWREGAAFVQLEGRTVRSDRPAAYRIRVLTRVLPEHGHEPGAVPGQGP
jgi:4-amino-4-deoxy-L-arabinose transferase-like glycosyltransferase